jgi:hypothetical protein
LESDGWRLIRAEKMMRSTDIAVRYALALCNDLPHFDKSSQHIENWFREMLAGGRESHKTCLRHVGAFSRALTAKLRAEEHIDTSLMISEDMFRHVSYLFCVYVTYTLGFTVNTTLRDRVTTYAATLEVTPAEALAFFKMISDDIWLVCEQKSEQLFAAQ